MSDTFKFLNNKQGQGSGAAQDFLKEKMSKNKYADVSDPSNPYSMGEGSTPGGEAYPQTIKPGTEKEVYTPNTYDYASDIWQHKLGPSSFTDAWDHNKYAQQIKAKGPINSEYDDKFAALTKSDSSVDDAEGWVTLKSRRNSEAGVQEEFESLAKEWKDAGYDVRTQDMDESVDGAKWADIAVRKGPGGETEITGEMEDPKPIKHSAEIKQAKERVQNYEQDVMSGKTSNEIYGKGEAMTEDKYNFDATQGAEGIGTSPVSASNQASTDATASFLNKKVSDTKDKYQFTPAS